MKKKQIRHEQSNSDLNIVWKSPETLKAEWNKVVPLKHRVMPKTIVCDTVGVSPMCAPNMDLIEKHLIDKRQKFV